jgi:hypothetical protein
MSARRAGEHRLSTLHPWDAATEIPIWRRCPFPHLSGLLDPGVVYFVLQLERMGARTTFSCEGHPGGFYIVFRARETLARTIASSVAFRVEIDTNPGWRLSLQSDPQTEAHRRSALRTAATLWQRRFGALDLDAARAWPPNRRFTPKRAT